MNPVQLIRMANQIGAFFEVMPDQTQAAKDVASHIQRTWEPRMRTALLAHVARTGGGELKPVVRDALPLIL
jgi:formate dehydrogenase subunit delta